MSKKGRQRRTPAQRIEARERRSDVGTALRFVNEVAHEKREAEFKQKLGK